jgi:hypothetical protein
MLAATWRLIIGHRWYSIGLSLLELQLIAVWHTLCGARNKNILPPLLLIGRKIRPTDMRHYGPSKRRETRVHRLGVTYQKTWISSNAAVRAVIILWTGLWCIYCDLCKTFRQIFERVQQKTCPKANFTRAPCNRTRLWSSVVKVVNYHGTENETGHLNRWSTRCPFYLVPGHGSCHGMSRRMQPCCERKLSCWGTCRSVHPVM